MKRFALAAGFVIGAAFPLQAEVRPLPVVADACAIFFALTLSQHPSCPAPVADDLGQARALDGAPEVPAPVVPKPAVSAAHKSWAENGYYIHFDFGSDRLDQTYKEHLTSLSNVLRADEMRRLCIKFVGHTDSVGSAKINKALSERRAKSVFDYMTGTLRIEKERLLSLGMGESQILDGVAPTDARNRRVEILAREMKGNACETG